MVVRKQRKSTRCESSLPSQSVAIFIEFRSEVVKNFNRDRKGWRGREYEYLQCDRRARERQRRLLKMDPTAQNTPGKTANGIGTEPTHEETDFNSLQDYSPPTFTLDDIGFPECNWKGEPFDLSEDPDSHLLHPEEIVLAANLRMDCATYLTNKRRIFIACIERMKVGKDFKKTNSQQACKIDVNKASKLWEAFNKVGWFENRHFSRVLRRHQWCLHTGGTKIF
ncbi:hypothetical protein DL98DRAFT_538559 [Cadophora sp. DSE1049]|nr:hypothetical protein DL98DRAFT_538559 [Cadophora sp. DSE1049]